MHLRYSTTRRKGKTYRYAQLVESYRRKDGKPAVRVVAHLGALPEPLVERLRVAVKAANSGQAVLLASEAAAMLDGLDVANRRYLDLAVLRDCWDHWELSSLLDELAGPSERSLAFSAVVLPLVLQRCCIPSSKLEATRWVPRTALPEILGFEPSAFNNTRVHRALDSLHTIDEQLQQRLVGRYQQRDGAFGALFMDVTDTYFEGIGCPLAQQTRTKTEMPNKRCIGIVLLVNSCEVPGYVESAVQRP